jgi:hypothetical protein
MSTTSALDRLPRQQEAELTAAAARIFRTAFPNPERNGCPPQGALVSVARKEGDFAANQRILEHLTCCSPCFAEYESLLHKQTVHRNLTILALCASLLITIGLAIWFYAFRGELKLRQDKSTIVQEQPAPRQAPPVQYQAALIDLRNRSPVRGEGQPSAADEFIASLPAQPLELSVYLPIGSEEGQYELRILREGDAPLATISGSARFEGRITVLRIRIDLTGLAPGRYLLGYRKANFRWTNYPIRLVP